MSRDGQFPRTVVTTEHGTATLWSDGVVTADHHCACPDTECADVEQATQVLAEFECDCDEDGNAP